jgi:MFS family permease
MLATLSERIPTKRQGLAFAVMNTTQPVGAFVGPVVGGPILDAYGFPTVLAIDAVLLAAVVLALAFVPLAVKTVYHGDNPGTIAGLVIGASGLTTTVLGPAVGSLADRWGIWRILFIVTALLVVLLPIPALAPDLVSFAVTWALVSGVAVGAYALSFNALANSVTTEVRGRVMALAYVPVNLAFIVGPAIGSVVASVNLFAVFPVASAVCLTGLALLVTAGRMGTTEIQASLTA